MRLRGCDKFAVVKQKGFRARKIFLSLRKSAGSEQAIQLAEVSAGGKHQSLTGCDGCGDGSIGDGDLCGDALALWSWDLTHWDPGSPA